MTASAWTLDPTDGQLQLSTGVTGPAAQMGHRLTIAMTAWQADVEWSGSEPASVQLVVDVGSLQVRAGEGGVTGLSGPEKLLARSNAVKTLDAKRYPHIRYRADAVAQTDGGYRLDGTLEIRGRVRERVLELRVEDLGPTWRMSGEAVVRHSEFGVKPYTMMMGAMKVADEVAVSFVAERAKDG